MTALSFADASFLKLTTPFWMDAVTFEIDPDGFLEFVRINRSTRKLHLLVASDD